MNVKVISRYYCDTSLYAEALDSTRKEIDFLVGMFFKCQSNTDERII